MDRMKLVIYCLLGLSISSAVHAQSVKNFNLIDVATKNEVSLTDFSDKKGVVVIFTSNVCP